MKRLDSVIALVRSLSKAEKKAFALQTAATAPEKTRPKYLCLYDMISRGGTAGCDAAAVRKAFARHFPDAAFEIEVKYLYDRLVQTIMSQRAGRDTEYALMCDIGRARMFYDRSLYDDCFDTLADVIDRADSCGHDGIVLIAQKIELEYLLSLDFPEMTEKELFGKHTMLQRALQRTRRIAEHSRLHDLLRYRLGRMGSVHSGEQQRMLADLAMNEFYCSTATDAENSFELSRNHKLFQANYMMGVGDYGSALKMYSELWELYESRPDRMRQGTTVYYLSVLEGALRALRYARNYSGMAYFLERLRRLADDASESGDVRLGVQCLIFQYELIPFLDNGDFATCRQVMDSYADTLLDRRAQLNPLRQSELLLYCALVHMGSGNYRQVRRSIESALVDPGVRYQPLMRTIRLVRLIAYYELGERELLESEARSMSRSRGHSTYATERIVLRFLTRTQVPPLERQRLQLLDKLRRDFNSLYDSKYERQLLIIFDFTAWIESKLTKERLSDAIQRHRDEQVF